MRENYFAELALAAASVAKGDGFENTAQAFAELALSFLKDDDDRMRADVPHVTKLPGRMLS